MCRFLHQRLFVNSGIALVEEGFKPETTRIAASLCRGLQTVKVLIEIREVIFQRLCAPSVKKKLGVRIALEFKVLTRLTNFCTVESNFEQRRHRSFWKMALEVLQGQWSIMGAGPSSLGEGWS